MPHSKKYTHTKEGYLIKIEDALNMVVPLSWWRVNIGIASNMLELIKKEKFIQLKRVIKLNKLESIELPKSQELNRRINKMKKTKSNIKGIPLRDQCQTPFYAVDPLIRVLKQYGYNPKKEKITVWEPFAGEGLMEKKLTIEGFRVIATDILDGVDFFETIKNPKIKQGGSLIISNPPFSRKYEIIKELYNLGSPWALLVPLDTLGAAKAQKLFNTHGVIKIFLDHRVNFKMPRLGWEGSADMATLWLFSPGREMKKETISIYEKINPKGIRGDESYYVAPTPEEIKKIRDESKRRK